MESPRSPSSAAAETQINTNRTAAYSYRDLQSKLEAMCYTEPLAVESVELVTHLIDDLTHATEQNVSLKRDCNVAKHENAKVFQQMMLFQKENAFLLQENSQLHLELIHNEEAMREERQRAELEIKAAENEARKLEFQSGELQVLLRKHERTIASLRKELEQHVSPGSALRPMEDMQRSVVQSSIRMNASAPSVAEEGSVSEAQSNESKAATIIAHLHAQLDTLKGENAALEEQCKTQKAQMEKRNEELERLHISGAMRSSDEKAEITAVTDMQVDKLQSHIDFLTDQVAKYEHKLKELGSLLKEQDNYAQKLTRANEYKEQISMELQATQTRFFILQEKYERMLQLADQEKVDVAPPLPNKDPQMEELLQLKNRLEDALRASHYEKLSYTNALNNALAHNRVLSSDLEQCHAQLKAGSAQCSQHSHTLTELKSRYAAQERELNVLRASMHQCNEQKTAESEKNLVLHRELRAMDAVLAQRDAENQELHRSIATYKCQIQVLEHEREYTLPVSQDEPSNRFQAIAEQERKWLAQTREEMRMEREQWTCRVTELEKTLTQLKLDLQSSELEREKLLKAKESMDELDKERETEMNEKTRAFHEQQQKLFEKCQETGELHALREDLSTKMESLEQLQSEYAKAQSEIISLRHHSDILYEEKTRLMSDLERSENCESKSHELLRQKTEELVHLEQQNRSFLQEKQQLIGEKEALVMEIAALRQRANRHETQCVELIQDVKAHKLSRSELESMFNSAKLEIAERETQLNTIQKQLIAKIAQVQQLEIELHDAKRDTRNIELDLEMEKQEKNLKEESIEKLKIALQKASTSLQEERVQSQKTEEKLTQCSLVLDTLKSTNDHKSFELQQLQQTNAKQLLHISDLKQSALDSEIQLEKHQNLIIELREQIQELEHAKDQVCDDMDIKLQSMQCLQQEHQALFGQIAQLQTENSSLSKQHSQCIQELDRQEAAFQELQSQDQEKAGDVQMLKQERALFVEERRAFLKDLENMTFENQRLNGICVELECAMENERQRISELKKYLQQMERERDALAIEKEDLERTYRQLAQEHTQLKNSRNESQTFHDELISANDSLRTEIRAKEEEFASVSAQYRQIQMELTTYRDQISQMTETLREKDDALSRNTERQKLLEDEMETQKYISSEISAQRFGAEAQRASSAQKLIALEAKLSSYQMDKKQCLEQIHREQLKNCKLESIAGSLRQKLIESEKKLELLKEQKDIMASEIMHLHRQRREKSPNMDISDLYTSPLHVESNTSPSGMPSLNDVETSPEDKDSPNMLPFSVLQKAREKCQLLENQLNKQDATIKQLERSRSKFKRFVVKYEQEIEQRDRLIEQLKSSASSAERHRSTFQFGAQTSQ